jgi:hypothetical protein
VSNSVMVARRRLKWDPWVTSIKLLVLAPTNWATPKARWNSPLAIVLKRNVAFSNPLTSRYLLDFHNASPGHLLSCWPRSKRELLYRQIQR